MLMNGAASVISSSDTVKGSNFQFPCPVGEAFGFEDVVHLLRISCPP